MKNNPVKSWFLPYFSPPHSNSIMTNDFFFLAAIDF